ncbi:MAG: acyl--CoA ligase [Lautropia sp.]|nr:acyl--CoA ligase [Lautropia sp.]
MHTLYEAVARQARLRPDALALAHAQGRVTYRELHQLAARAAAGLRARGVGAHDVVAIQLPNSLPFVVLLLAAGAVGATVQMLHMPYRRAELSALLRHGRASLFVGLPAFKDETPLATVSSLELVRLLVSGAEQEQQDAATGGLTWSSLTSPDTEAPAFPPVDPGSRYVLLHTSGTTADPKGVPVSHHQFIGNAAASIEPLRVRAADVILPAAPFTHLYGLFALELGLLAGAAISLLPAFTPAGLLESIRRDGVTAVFAGPAHFRPVLSMTDAKVLEPLADVRLICLSGTAVATDLARAVEALMSDGKVIQLWGMSELQAGTYGRPDDPEEIRHRTAGRPSPGTELRIRTAHGASAPGRTGALQVRGPSLFTGYLDDPAATAAAFEDGWFNTGDLGYLTPDGALVLTGRIKEIINRGGIKFNPLDVEAVIDTLPGVVRSAVVPMPDPVLGERACAFVQASSALTLEQVSAALDQAGIARYKWPERLEMVEEMPMTPTQKIMRGRLTARFRKAGGDHE